MKRQFELDVLAEMAAQGQAVIKVLSGFAALTALETGSKSVYLSKILEAGLRDLEKTNYWSVPPDQLSDFLETVKARYSEIVTAAGTEQA